MKQMKLPLAASHICPSPASKILDGIVSPHCRCKCKLGAWLEWNHRAVERLEQAKAEREKDVKRLDASLAPVCGSSELVCHLDPEGADSIAVEEVVDATLSYFALFMIWEALSESCPAGIDKWWWERKCRNNLCDSWLCTCYWFRKTHFSAWPEENTEMCYKLCGEQVCLKHCTVRKSLRLRMIDRVRVHAYVRVCVFLGDTDGFPISVLQPFAV